MNRLDLKKHNKVQRKVRIRSVVHGTAERPRLSIFVSNRHISAQVINDDTHQTIVSVTSVGKKQAGSMSAKAEQFGAEVAKKAKAKKINRVALDRNGRLYHGRIKAFADAARKEGLDF